ncbi:MAG TPA: MFS transporter [Longilinea sp.]|nr:MFS transporter [Longilinea sp.]
MNRNLLLTAISLLTWGIGEGLFLVFQPLFLQELGADPVQIGVILGIAGVAMTVFHIPAGFIGDKIGPHRLMQASWIIGLVATAIMALSTSLTTFVIGLVLYGATAFGVTPMNSYVTHARGKWSVARALTFISAMFNLGAVIGPTLGGLIVDHLGMHATFYFAGGIFVVSTVIILFIKAEPVEPVHKKDQGVTPGFFRLLPFFAAIFLTLFALYLPQPLTPNFLQDVRGLSSQGIGVLGSIGNLGNAVVALTLGSLLPAWGMIIGQFLVAGAAIAFWQGTGVIWYGLGYFLFSGYRLVNMMILAFIRPSIPPQNTGLVFGFVATINGLAIILAPMVAGLLFDQRPVLIYTTALGALMLSLISTGIALLFMKKRRQNQPVD